MSVEEKRAWAYFILMLPEKQAITLIAQTTSRGLVVASIIII